MFKASSISKIRSFWKLTNNEQRLKESQIVWEPLTIIKDDYIVCKENNEKDQFKLK